MPISLPNRPNVRRCTHIKVTGQQCGSPALRGEIPPHRKFAQNLSH